MCSQDEPISGNAPTYGDLFLGGLMGNLERPPEQKLKGNDTPGVGSVVQVPCKAKVESGIF